MGVTRWMTATLACAGVAAFLVACGTSAAGAVGPREPAAPTRGAEGDPDSESTGPADDGHMDPEQGTEPPPLAGPPLPPAVAPPPPGDRLRAATGADGSLSTWRVLARGPVTPEEHATLGAFCEDADQVPEGCEPELLVQEDAVMDLGREDRAGEIHLGVHLRATQPTRLYLLVGVRGAVTVHLDGTLVGAVEEDERFHEDEALVPLSVDAGEHALVLSVKRGARGRFRFHTRLVDARYAPGPGGVAVELGRLPDDRALAYAADAVHAAERYHLTETLTPSSTVTLSLPGGGVDTSLPWQLGQAGGVLVSRNGRYDATATQTLAVPARGRLEIDARIGPRTLRLGREVFGARPLLQAMAALTARRDESSSEARAPLRWRLQEMQRVLDERDPDAAWRTWLTREARTLARQLERGRDPFASPHGYQRMAFESPLDGTAQPYELFVPPAYRGRRDWPVVITLHGYKGNAGDYFRNTFGLARRWREGESLLDHGRHGTPPTTGPMFVIAPMARGQSMYRHAGEVDVLLALADVRERFRIDPNRIYITGGSMGGTGAAYLPFRHPDLFSASAALAGYHDQRIREDTNHVGLSAVERYVQAHRSDVDWAENALHLPMLLVRGTRDRPLEWTRSLVRRLEALDYDVEHREPESGHNVWTETYDAGAIFSWFARYTRPTAPSHVRLRTARERTRDAWWLHLDARSRADAFAEIDAHVSEPATVVVTTENVDALTLAAETPITQEGTVQLRVDDVSLEGALPLHVSRASGTWRVVDEAPSQAGRKRPGVEGPIRDVFHDPLVFVVGTQDPAHTWMNRRVAETWAHPKGWEVTYPIVDDVAVTDAMLESATLVLVGPPWSNAVLARMHDRLPIRFVPHADGARLVVNGQAHHGAEVGTVFVAPNPEAPNRSVLVIAGLTPFGTWRSTFLPDILPDYVVFDAGVAPARDEWACGGTGCRYLASGIFTLDWQFPEGPPPDPGDPAGTAARLWPTRDPAARVRPTGDDDDDDAADDE